MAEIASRFKAGGGISDAKRALLERRMRGQSRAARSVSAMPLRPATEPRWASLGQQTIWLLDQAADDPAAYNITSSFHVSGPLDLARLEASVRRVRARHEILRCTYRARGDGVEQVLVDEEWAGIERWEAADENDFEVLAERVARSPLDVTRGPLWRLHHVARPGPEPAGLLMLVIHDIIFDKWSILRFWKEVGTVYQALEKGLEPELEPLERQFSDFASWQRRRMQEELGEAQLAYWREHLRDPPAPVPLPTDRPYPPELTLSGRLAGGTVPATVAERVRALAAAEDASVFMVSLLAFQVLVQRHAAVDDIVIASPVANRRTPETATMLGFLLSTVPLRTDLRDDPSVREALRRARAAVLGAITHQDIPLDRIVEAVKPPRVAGRHTLAQVMFVYQRHSEAEPPLALEGVTVENTYVETCTSKFDFTLFVAEAAEGFQTIAEYRTDLFDHSTVERWLEQYARLLEAMVADPEQSIAQLDFLTPFERTLGRAAMPLPATPERTVVAAIRQRCLATPKSPAVQGGDVRLSFGELWDWSGSIAAAIRQRVGSPSRIGLFMGREPAAVASILGILRAGAAYVPVDPDYPPARNRAILKDAGVDCVVVSPGTAAAAAELTELACCEVTERHEMPASAEADPEWAEAEPVYLLYTSGSSGTPKGVEVTHANLWSSTRARTVVYEEDPGRYLLLSSFAFDSSVAGIFWTIAGGGTLVLPTAEEMRDPMRLAMLIRSRGVTTTLGIPRLYQEILRADPGALGSLRRVIVAGEACPPPLVGAHFKALPDCALWNEYGPTEGTVWATVHRCGPEDAVAAAVPIGRPIPGSAVHLLDAALHPVPIGGVGELWIGGSGVARGYRGNGELTAERFRELAGRGRNYRTGDLGRWRADGSLVFAGRIDHQVKVNGLRIELGEIEQALENHPAVEEAIVTLVEDPVLDSIEAANAIIQEQASLVPPDVLEEWILDLDDGAMGRPDRSIRGENFRLDLHVADAGFVASPRKRQRDWILGQAMQEFAADLEHLDRVAATFVPGYDHELNKDLKDISQAKLNDRQIMEDWMTPLMRAMVERVTERPGDVLEIGFGRGVAAEMIQRAGVRSHHVVEMDDHCVDHYFKPWRARHAERDIRLFHARWQDVEQKFGLYDGILFHAFPVNEEEFEEYALSSVAFAEHAFGPMAAHLKPGGVFTYLTTEIDSLARRHQRALFRHFRRIELEVAPMQVPRDTHDTWWAQSMVVIKAVK